MPRPFRPETAAKLCPEFFDVRRLLGQIWEPLRATKVAWHFGAKPTQPGSLGSGGPCSRFGAFKHEPPCPRPPRFAVHRQPRQAFACATVYQGNGIEAIVGGLPLCTSVSPVCSLKHTHIESRIHFIWWFFSFISVSRPPLAVLLSLPCPCLCLTGRYSLPGTEAPPQLPLRRAITRLENLERCGTEPASQIPAHLKHQHLLTVFLSSLDHTF